MHVARCKGECYDSPVPQIKPKVGGGGGCGSDSFGASISLIFKILDMISIDHRGELGTDYKEHFQPRG